jgi:hypothetical protein
VNSHVFKVCTKLNVCVFVKCVHSHTTCMQVRVSTVCDYLLQERMTTQLLCTSYISSASSSKSLSTKTGIMVCARLCLLCAYHQIETHTRGPSTFLGYVNVYVCSLQLELQLLYIIRYTANFLTRQLLCKEIGGPTFPRACNPL